MKLVIIFLATLLVLSCNDDSRTNEVKKQEKGLVVAMQYAAPADGHGSTTTINTKGGMGFGSTSIHMEEKYMVVFRCEHGVVFSIDKQSLYAKLDEKDSVVIDYYEYSNPKGEVTRLDFIDANKLKP